MDTRNDAPKTDTLRLYIFQDELAEDPREWDNQTVMYCDHPRHILGDKDAEYPTGDCISLPLYLYDHSGLRISTGPGVFPDRRFDVSFIGYIYVTPKILTEEFNNDKTKALAAMKSEVDTYNTWLSGDVWAYIIQKLIECPECHHTELKHVDSCGGFYGSDHTKSGLRESLGDYAYLLEE